MVFVVIAFVVIVAARALSFSPDAIHFFFQREPIKRRQGQREKKIDSAVEDKKRVAVGARDFGGVAFDRGGVGNSPVRGHRMSRPNGAGFFRSIVANREDEVHFGSSGLREFVPTLTAQPGGGYVSQLELLDRFRTNRARGMASRAVGDEDRLSFVVEDRFGHDGTGGVTGAQKKNVEVNGHFQSP